MKVDRIGFPHPDGGCRECEIAKVYLLALKVEADTEVMYFPGICPLLTSMILSQQKEKAQNAASIYLH